MIVVEDEHRFVVGIRMAGDARVARTQVAIGNVRGQRGTSAIDRFAMPRAVAAIRRDDDPLASQRMPALLERHATPA